MRNIDEETIIDLLDIAYKQASAVNVLLKTFNITVSIPESLSIYYIALDAISSNRTKRTDSICLDLFVRDWVVEKRFKSSKEFYKKLISICRQ